MTLPAAPDYPVADIEQRAARLLVRHYGAAVPIPVDVDLLVEREPDVTLDYLPGLLEVHGIVGAVVRYPGFRRLVVLVDAGVADQNPNFYRFTVAEELGHLILHRQVVEQVRSLREAAALHAWEGYRRMDRNAKRFAAAVLMPPAQILRDAAEVYPQLVAVAGFGSVEAVQGFLVDRLARKYRVSTRAMGHRLGEWPIRVVDRVAAAMRDKLRFLPGDNP